MNVQWSWSKLYVRLLFIWFQVFLCNTNQINLWIRVYCHAKKQSKILLVEWVLPLCSWCSQLPHQKRESPCNFIFCKLYWLSKSFEITESHQTLKYAISDQCEIETLICSVELCYDVINHGKKVFFDCFVFWHQLLNVRFSWVSSKTITLHFCKKQEKC